MTKKQQSLINEQWARADEAIMQLAKLTFRTPRSSPDAAKLDEAINLLDRAKEILAELSPDY